MLLYFLLLQGIRADGNSDLSNEIGEELSVKSAAAGLRYGYLMALKVLYGFCYTSI